MNSDISLQTSAFIHQPSDISPLPSYIIPQPYSSHTLGCF